jgi:integrase
LLSVAKQPLYDVLLIIQDAGMRPEEVFRMRWENILWNRNVIFIPFGKSRLGSRRFVPLSSRVRQRLELRRSAGNSDWVFPSQRSRSGHIVSVAKQFEQARRDADLPVTLVLYCARHTFATDLLAQTGNLALVRDVLGHRDIKTTEKYLHPASTQLAEIIDLRNAKNG